MSAQAVIYLFAIAGFVLAAFVPAIGRASTALLAFAVFILAFAWPVITG